MKRWPAAAALILLWAMSSAFGNIANPPTVRALYQRVAWSDLIVVGKVAEIEKQPARDDELPGQPTGWYTRVARLEVSEVLLGPDKVKSLRLAVNPMWLKPPASWYDLDRMYGKGNAPKEMPRVQPLEKGRQGIFFLSRRSPGQVYVSTDHPIFTDKGDPVYEAELKRCKRLVRLLTDPKASLRSTDLADRRATASMLLWRYTTDRYGTNKTELIDAEESKLILGVLADSKWTQTARDPDEAPMHLLYGWVYPTLNAGSDAPRRAVSVDDFAPLREWVQQNREKYRIRRYVWERKQGADLLNQSLQQAGPAIRLLERLWFSERPLLPSIVVRL